MQFFYWLMFLIVIAVAIFAIQNSAAPLITIKLLIWKFETSLVYAILGSIGLGILFTLLFWIPRALRASFRARKSSHQVPST
jgi:uncharacterized integral membrane protein